MAKILVENLHVVRFVYGLIFFSLGFAILLQPRRQSAYFLAPALSWLAAFALIHAFADWGLVFIPPDSQGGLRELLLEIRSLGVIISFGLLMQFGITLLTQHWNRYRALALLPSALTALFVLLLLLDFNTSGILPSRLAETKIFARYLLGFPAAILSAWGLVGQADELRRGGLREHVIHLYGAASCFVIYGVVAGLIVPARPFIPASILNEQVFLERFGTPVEVVRGLAMLGVTLFALKLLGIFQAETQRRLQAAERDRALLREREVIARELHDGIMQTLYGTGLGLKQVMALAPVKDGTAVPILATLSGEIARSIVQMRSFVLDLKEAAISGSELADAVQGLASDIGQFAGIEIALSVDGDLGQCRIPGGLREEVLAVIREGLSNTVRHSGAGEARILLSMEDGTILLRISDNGQGFDTAHGPGKGLATLRDRIEALGGYMQVLSTPQEGTQLVVHLPVRSKLIHQEG